MTQDGTIAFLGAGNMAGALIRGLLRAEVYPPERIVATDVRADRLQELAATHGVRTSSDNAAAAKEAEVVVLATKPQVMPRLLGQIHGCISTSQLVVSIAAGVPSEVIEAALPDGSRVVRVMPNTPALVDAGASVVSLGRHATVEDGERTTTLFRSVGMATVVDESLQNAATGLSGSGPAYVFLVIEALADGGVKEGLPRDTAQRLAAQTVLGAAKLLLETGEHPGQLKDRVASPAGTTIAGLHALERGGLRRTLIDAVEAASARARELGVLARTRRS